MPWDVIQPAVYPQTNQIETLLPELQVRHDTRTADHPDFNYLRSLSERARENGRRTHLSLNESTRTAEKEAEDAWRLGLENELRVANGEEPVESLDALEELLTAKRMPRKKRKRKRIRQMIHLSRNPARYFSISSA